MNNFIIFIDDTKPDNVQLNISVNLGHCLTKEIPLGQTALVQHPHAHIFYKDFSNFESAAQARIKWYEFLNIYLDKENRKF